jgi:hypothetical protein
VYILIILEITTMKLSFITSTAAICLLTSTAFAAPTTMTDAQMAEIVAAGPAHQSAASDLKGEVATLMPGHVLGLGEGEYPGNAHQSAASGLKGDMAGFMPGHVNP